MHEGLYYSSLDEFLAGTLDFVRFGLTAAEPVLIAVPEPRLGLLHVELGAAGAGVRFLDMAEVGRNPNRILPWVLQAFVDEHKAQRVRIVGEPIFVGRTPEEFGPCVQHEALINVAFAGVDAAILCPYDVARLPAAVADAERTHPIIVTGEGRRPSEDYTDPYQVVAMHNLPLPERIMVDNMLVFDVTTIADIRRVVGEHAEAAGLARDRIADAQLAVTEVGTNAVTHGGVGLATLRMWSDGGRVVYEVRGAGRISEIMAGRIVPAQDSPRGRGLLMANRLCDLVQTYTVPSGTVTRLHLRLSASR